MRSIAYDHQIFSLQEYGGISRYFVELATRMHRQTDFGARVLAPLHFNRYLRDGSVPLWGGYVSRRVVRAGRVFRAVNRLLEPAMLRALAPALLHRTYFGPADRAGGYPLVVTVFDMIHELCPQDFPAGDPVPRYKLRSVGEADHVICISESTANDVVRMLGVPRTKISVTHLGFSHELAAAAAGGPDARDRHARPYFLYVGQRAGYKNFERLLRAYSASAMLVKEFDLVAFGGGPWQGGELALIDSLGLREGAVQHRAGSDLALARAYRDALAFVYPSEYEGFGIPPLEAMSCGVPVVCSDASSIPEVTGPAGEYFKPTDVDSIRAALERVASDPQRRSELIAAGAVRCQQFSWDRCVNETASIYRSVIGH
jgi:glycosyltransferase involved in cell wall biosynthesis